MASEKTPWYRSAGATAAAGLLGLALIAILVMTVVNMSSKWTSPETAPVLPPGTHLPEPPQFAGTTTASTSTSYPSVRLSTTDIGLPGESTTSDTSSTEPTPSALPTDGVAPTFPGSFPTRVTNPPGPRTTRPGPRLNVTRTASP